MARHGTACHGTVRHGNMACSTSTCMLRTHTRTVALLGIDLICSSGQVPVMPAHGCTHSQHKRLRALASMHMPMQAPMRCCLSYTLTALSSSFGVRHTGSACVRACVRRRPLSSRSPPGQKHFAVFDRPGGGGHKVQWYDHSPWPFRTGDSQACRGQAGRVLTRLIVERVSAAQQKDEKSADPS